MFFHKLTLGPLGTNCYIVADEVTREAVCFDPADDAENILGLINREKYDLKAVLLTHFHFDHVLALELMRAQASFKLYVGEKWKETFDGSIEFGKSFDEYSINALAVDKIKFDPDMFLHDNDIIEIGNIDIKAIHTPGHSCDSFCFLIENILISGDTLFFEAIGRTDLPTGNYSSEISSIKNKLFLLKPEIHVYPGHGNSTTIKHEIHNNPYLKQE